MKTLSLRVHRGGSKIQLRYRPVLMPRSRRQKTFRARHRRPTSTASCSEWNRLQIRKTSRDRLILKFKITAVCEHLRPGDDGSIICFPLHPDYQLEPVNSRSFVKRGYRFHRHPFRTQTSPTPTTGRLPWLKKARSRRHHSACHANLLGKATAQPS